MPRYSFVVHSNPVAGREDEYNEWYSKEHLPALMRIPGMISAKRFRHIPQQLREGEPAFRYLAIYEIETDKPETFFGELMARAGTERLPTSSALAPGASPVLWELMEPGA